MTALAVNGERLWSTLMEMADIGGTAKGGCNRQALTEKDKIGRELFIRWCKDIGCTMRVLRCDGDVLAREERLDRTRRLWRDACFEARPKVARAAATCRPAVG